MFLSENNHGIVKNKDIIHRTLFGTLSFIMDNLRVWEIIIVVTAKLYAVREVDVFAIHKKCFVEQTHFVERRFTHQHKGTRKYIYFMYFIFI